MNARGMLVGCAIMSAALAHGQANGIRVIVPALESLYSGTPISPFMGFGYDHDFDEHIGMSLEASFLVRGWFRSDIGSNEDDQLEYAGWYAYWQDTRKAWTLSYRTSYFFSGSSSGSAYMGSFIGVRGLKREVEITDQYEQNGWTGSSDGPFASRYSGDAMVFPVGLRFGYRGPLDGSYYDLYGGLGYQLAGGENLIPRAELADGPFTTRTFTWHIGLSYGVGW